MFVFRNVIVTVYVKLKIKDEICSTNFRISSKRVCVSCPGVPVKQCLLCDLVCRVPKSKKTISLCSWIALHYHEKLILYYIFKYKSYIQTLLYQLLKFMYFPFKDNEHLKIKKKNTWNPIRNSKYFVASSDT